MTNYPVIFRDYFINHCFWIPSLTNQYFMESRSGFFRESQVNEVNMSSCTVTYATNCFNAKRQWFRSVSPWDGCCWGRNSRHLGNHANCDYAWRCLPLQSSHQKLLEPPLFFSSLWLLYLCCMSLSAPRTLRREFPISNSPSMPNVKMAPSIRSIRQQCSPVTRSLMKRFYKCEQRFQRNIKLLWKNYLKCTKGMNQ